MNKEELESIITKLNVSPLSYSLSGGLPNEKYVLDQGVNKWSVYYSERGQKSSERVFKTEDEACRYMLKCISGDLTTQLVDSQSVKRKFVEKKVAHRISNFNFLF